MTAWLAKISRARIVSSDGERPLRGAPTVRQPTQELAGVERDPESLRRQPPVGPRAPRDGETEHVAALGRLAVPDVVGLGDPVAVRPVLSDLAGRDLLSLHQAPAAVEAVLRMVNELIVRGVVEGQENGVEAEAAPDTGHDRLEEGVERQVLLELVGDLEDRVQRLGALSVALGQVLDLRPDRAVLKHQSDLAGEEREGREGGLLAQGRKRALGDQEAGRKLVGRKPHDGLVLRPR